ncbi:MAG: ParB/Srx family N-terminal domain-containing protein [Oxalobacter formigenes]|nr:ParB/Srx family N-terminal domain-containing protein [Oxalobacter formigenes]MCM1528340.1 ParB/Srx family N-terminal domain-containing protein [Bacteroides sp.]
MTEKNQLKVQYVQTEKLVPYVNNARVHDEHQINQIAASIKEFGFNNPILTDGDNGVVAGHGRLYAALKLGLEKVPVIELSHLTPSKKKAYILADNRIAENARWDHDLLKIEAEDIKLEGIDIELTGFSLSEIDNFELADFFTEEEKKPEKSHEPKTIVCPHCGEEFEHAG